MFPINQRQTRRGLSSIETLMAVVLLSASVTAATYTLSPAVESDPARETAQSFASMLREARAMAIKNHSKVIVQFDQSKTPARWTFDATPGLMGGAKQWELACDPSVIVSGTPGPIRIDDFGNASFYCSWTVQGTHSYAVQLEPIGARVAMKANE